MLEVDIRREVLVLGFIEEIFYLGYLVRAHSLDQLLVPLHLDVPPVNP